MLTSPAAEPLAASMQLVKLHSYFCMDPGVSQYIWRIATGFPVRAAK